MVQLYNVLSDMLHDFLEIKKIIWNCYIGITKWVRATIVKLSTIYKLDFREVKHILTWLLEVTCRNEKD